MALQIWQRIIQIDRFSSLARLHYSSFHDSNRSTWTNLRSRSSSPLFLSIKRLWKGFQLGVFLILGLNLLVICCLLLLLSLRLDRVPFWRQLSKIFLLKARLLLHILTYLPKGWILFVNCKTYRLLVNLSEGQGLPRATIDSIFNVSR